MEKIKKTNYTEPPFEDAFEGIESLVVREGFSKVLYNDVIDGKVSSPEFEKRFYEVLGKKFALKCTNKAKKEKANDPEFSRFLGREVAKLYVLDTCVSPSYKARFIENPAFEKSIVGFYVKDILLKTYSNAEKLGFIYFEHSLDSIVDHFGGAENVQKQP